MGCRTNDADRLYKLLEVEKNASRNDIRKAHQKLARVHHPDRGGDAEKFKEIQKAYEVLSDPEKRAKYDESGEEGLERNDDFDFFRGWRTRPQHRRKTKNIETPLKMTLEQLYGGVTKKMAVNRQVVDKSRGVQTCQECSGSGMKTEVIRLGNMVQHAQTACGACSSTGKVFTHKKEREVLQVHVQRGAPDGHKVVFREKADEMPDADTGDVVFVVKEQKHPEFKRRGADLFIERKISLVEALCGFELELTHLDGRKLIIKTALGEIVSPMSRGFDPLADQGAPGLDWECMDGYDCPGIQSVATANESDVDLLKKACETQLKHQGLDIGAFVVDGNKAYFKHCTRQEALAAKEAKSGAKMYVVVDPGASKQHRLMKAVAGEGMPTLKNPFVHGNLFVILTIDFPDHLTPESQDALRKILPPPLHESKVDRADPGVEEHTLVDIDPRASQAANAIHMSAGEEAYDEDERPGNFRAGPQDGQCQQM